MVSVEICRSFFYHGYTPTQRRARREGFEMFQKEEYNALKNEILQIQEFEFDSQKTMISIVIAIFAIAFPLNNPWILSISYLPLISFQSIINKKRIGRIKISAYIEVYYSEHAQSWERALHRVPAKLSSVKYKYPFIQRVHSLSRMSAFFLALLVALCACILFIKQNPALGTDVLLQLVCLLLLQIVCVDVIFNLNKKIYYVGDARKEFLRIFREIEREDAPPPSES